MVAAARTIPATLVVVAVLVAGCAQGSSTASVNTGTSAALGCTSRYAHSQLADTEPR